MFSIPVSLFGKTIAAKTGLAVINALKDELNRYIHFRKERLFGGGDSSEVEATVSELDRKLDALSESEDRQTVLIERLVELEDQHSTDLVSLSNRLFVFQWISIVSLGVGISALVLTLIYM
jgi:hypothetical protein